MVAIPLGTGIFYNDPRLMHRWYETAALSLALYQGTTARGAGGANFFTELGVRGVAVDSNWTGGSKKTLLASTSPTLLFHVVGPAQAVGDTAIYEIVVDGITYTLPTTPAAVAGCRSFLGPLVYPDTFTTSPNNLATLSTIANSSGWGNFAATSYLPPPYTFATLGMPCLQARSSLTVSITVSAGITATANQERQAGCAYRVVA